MTLYRADTTTPVPDVMHLRLPRSPGSSAAQMCIDPHAAGATSSTAMKRHGAQRKLALEPKWLRSYLCICICIYIYMSVTIFASELNWSQRASIMNRWFKPSLSIQIRIYGLSPVPVFLSTADAGVCNWHLLRLGDACSFACLEAILKKAIFV